MADINGNIPIVFERKLSTSLSMLYLLVKNNIVAIKLYYIVYNIVLNYTIYRPVTCLHLFSLIVTSHLLVMQTFHIEFSIYAQLYF